MRNFNKRISPNNGPSNTLTWNLANLLTYPISHNILALNNPLNNHINNETNNKQHNHNQHWSPHKYKEKDTVLKVRSKIFIHISYYFYFKNKILIKTKMQVKKEEKLIRKNNKIFEKFKLLKETLFKSIQCGISCPRLFNSSPTYLKTENISYFSVNFLTNKCKQDGIRIFLSKKSQLESSLK